MSSPENYNNLLEAFNGLLSRGYHYDFNYENACLFCNKISEKFNAEDLKITEYYRFEGMSDPEDNSIIYAIESKDGHRGIIIDAYGTYSDEHKTAFISNIEVVEN